MYILDIIMIAFRKYLYTIILKVKNFPYLHMISHR